LKWYCAIDIGLKWLVIEQKISSGKILERNMYSASSRKVGEGNMYLGSEVSY
jgi:hypothetical protein